MGLMNLLQQGGGLVVLAMLGGLVFWILVLVIGFRFVFAVERIAEATLIAANSLRGREPGQQ